MSKTTPERDPKQRYRAALGRAGLEDTDVAGLFNHDLTADLLPSDKDVTSWAFVDKKTTATAVMRARQPGTLAGLDLLYPLPASFRHADFTSHADDGERLDAGQVVATFTGRLRDILTLERTALNFVNHLSGVATLTAAYVDALRGTKAKVCDTRKTLPGLKRLQKYAVDCGGGTPHRQSLGDAMLVKDNHLAHVPPGELAGAITEAAERARKKFPELKFVMVEVDTLEQLHLIRRCPIDIVLLDNMTSDELREAVRLRDADAPGLQLEASGGVTLDTIRGIAETGVDRISVGALTHSAPSLDLGFDIDAGH